MELKDAIISAFKNNANKKEMHYRDIALYIKTSIADFKDVDLALLEKRVNARLANDLTKTVKGKKVENKESKFVTVSNGKRNKKGKFGRKAGVYSLRATKITPSIIPVKPNKKNKKGTLIQPALFGDSIPQRIPNKDGKKVPNPSKTPIVTTKIFDDLTTGQIGKGGEFAVISELLFRGFNANTTVVDDGVDIVCSQGNKFYLIQVKTREYKGDTVNVSIKKDSFDRYNEKNTYYIIVLRYLNKSNIPTNQYLVFMASDIQRFVGTSSANINQNSINLKFKTHNGELFIYNGNKEQSINYHLDKFDLIR
jgi:hypothetical protein